MTKDSLACQGERGSLREVATLGFPAPKAHPCVYFHTLSMRSTQGSRWSTGAVFSVAITRAPSPGSFRRPLWASASPLPSFQPQGTGVIWSSASPSCCHFTFPHRKRKMNVPYRSQKIYFQIKFATLYLYGCTAGCLRAWTQVLDPHPSPHCCVTWD